MKYNRLASFDGCAFTSEEEIVRTLPESIILIRYGINAYTKNNESGEFEFTQEDADCIIADFEAKGHDLVIDYEHQSLSGEKAPAAGWIHRLEKCPEGIKAHIRYWTDEAKNFLLAGQYRYFSPTLYFSRSGKHVTAIHSAALTNHPAMHRIPALVADDIHVSAECDIRQASEKKPPEPLTLTKEEHMNELLMKLGIASFSSADEQTRKEMLEERIDALLQTEERVRNLLDRKGFTDLAGAEEALDLAQKMKQDLQVRKAFEEGKLSESMRSWAERFASSDPVGFDLWASEAPRIIPDNQDTECRDPDPFAENAPDFDPEQNRILHLLGLSSLEMKTDPETEMKGNN